MHGEKTSNKAITEYYIKQLTLLLSI